MERGRQDGDAVSRQDMDDLDFLFEDVDEFLRLEDWALMVDRDVEGISNPSTNEDDESEPEVEPEVDISQAPGLLIYGDDLALVLNGEVAPSDSVQGEEGSHAASEINSRDGQEITEEGRSRSDSQVGKSGNGVDQS